MHLRRTPFHPAGRPLRRFTLLLVAALALAGPGTTPTAHAALGKKDFSLTAKPAISLAAGKSTSVRITVRRGSAFTSPLAFTTTHPLTGVVATVGVVSAKSATLRVRVDTTAPSQVGQIGVTATGGGISRTFLLSVKVTGGTSVAASPTPPPTTGAASPTPPPTSAAPVAATTIPAPTTVAPVVTTGPGRKLDLLFAERDGEDANNNPLVKYSMALSKGNGSFEVKPTNLTKLPPPSDYQLTDLNGDGLADVVATMTKGPSTRFVVMFNKGGGTFEVKDSNITLPDGTIRLSAVGDTNGDGRGDVVISQKNGTDGSLFVIALSKGDGTFNVIPQNSKTLGKTRFLKIADVTGDGRNDILVFDDIGNSAGRLSVGITTSNSDITFTEGHVGPIPPSGGFLSTGFDVGDVDGDGQAEAVAVIENGQGSNIFLVGRFDPPTKKFVWGPTNLTATKAGPLLYVGDLTGDGRADLLTNNENFVSIAISKGSTFELVNTSAGLSLLGFSKNLGDLG